MEVLVPLAKLKALLEVPANYFFCCQLVGCATDVDRIVQAAISPLVIFWWPRCLVHALQGLDQLLSCIHLISESTVPLNGKMDSFGNLGIGCVRAEGLVLGWRLLCKVLRWFKSHQISGLAHIWSFAETLKLLLLRMCGLWLKSTQEI